MYFDNFPTIIYDSEKENVFKDVKNLLRRVAIRAKVKSNTLLYDTYDVKNGETPESIAHKLYDDAELHWVIMLVNEAQFLQFVNDKYDNVDGVHHYEISQTSGDTSIKIDVGTSNSNYPTATAITNFEYEQEQQDSKRKIRLLDPIYIDPFVEEFKSLMNESII
jgi:hypothetical protein